MFRTAFRQVATPVLRTQTVAWRRFLSDDLRSQIDKAVKDHDVLVFMKGNKEQPQCGFSRAVVQILQANGVDDFKTVNVLADEKVRSGIKEYSNWPTIPQVYVKGEFVGGCDIIMGMHQSGELQQFLENEGILPKEEGAKQ
ncbi:monothiol glutaredoxin grx5 [Rhizophlyctis rosea]|uniref:Monothiol glutaredoxin-5, mitochondrial n=1 Tax=Rhizophlyctis rosea TaxID=64517 RepID=A0AAD5SA21_9FUNG|nr:monothiol glutaredoxin grx5 [Rhizophlyctis rosea]